MLNRRRFLQWTGVVAAGSALRPTVAWSRPQGGLTSLQRLTISPTMTALIGEGGNSLVALTDAGPILIDTKLGYVGGALLDQVRKIATTGPSLLINTHHHGDHIGGNWAFASTPDRIAQANLKPRVRSTVEGKVKGSITAKANELARSGHDADAAELHRIAEKLDAASFMPTRDFRDQQELDHGGRKLILRHFGPGHTDNDTVIHFPEVNVIQTGDLVFNRGYPFIDRDAGADTRLWQDALRKTLQLCDDSTAVIPGHGDVGRKDMIEAQIEFFDKVRAIVQDSIAAGRSREEVTALKPDAFQGYSLENIRPLCLGAVFDELSKVAP